MRKSFLGTVFFVMLALVPGCKKGEGATCYKWSDCSEGLACVGTDVKRCEACDKTKKCETDGLCTAKEGMCVAASDDQCKKSGMCKEGGNCTAKDNKCVAGSDEDCKQSDACKSQGYCKAQGGGCMK